MLTFWNSRNKLAFGSLICVVLLAFLNEENDPIHPPVEPAIDLIEDVDYAIEAMDYMSGLKNGKSSVRGVVETEKSLEEWYWSCRKHRPKEIKSAGWIENSGLFLYSAYFDERENSLFPNNPSIQILLMSWRTLENRTEIYCSLNSNKGSAVVKGFIREIWQRAWDPRDLFYVPSLVTCPVPNRLQQATNISIFVTREPCGKEEAALEVVFPEKAEEKKAVAVCVKGMDFQDDISSKLVEWLEAVLLFGADKITIYSYFLSEKTKQVLDYYGKLGKVEQIYLDFPGNSPNFPPTRSSYIWRNRQQKRRHELIPYNDCLYRHLGSHNYILILDTDEIIVPLRYSTYGEMLLSLDSTISSKKISSIMVRNVFKFPKNSTENDSLFFLANNQRSKKTSGVGEYGKSFSKIENVASVFNHFALHRLGPKVAKSIHIPEEMAVKLHYKSSCPVESRHECHKLEEDTVIDRSLDNYAGELEKRVKDVLKNMNF